MPILRAAGADLEAKNIHNDRLVHLAAERNIEALNGLIEEGAQFNPTDNRTPNVCKGLNGQITVTNPRLQVSGTPVSANFTYILDGNEQTSPVFSAVSAGTHIVQIKASG